MFKEESKLGELFDPIADKILVAAALILLVMNGTIKNYEVNCCNYYSYKRNFNIWFKRVFS